MFCHILVLHICSLKIEIGKATICFDAVLKICGEENQKYYKRNFFYGCFVIQIERVNFNIKDKEEGGAGYLI